ncbi:acyl carrier protein [Micromonospora sagamiensis]|uniref:Acyl carrier protein n=1 Tax=Micromonospora sagamiensis TaxID=47875 RepID=A0A562WFI7_9ACTN|nr:phosphopantetheine-binding protein [Micromonospora sagamiensis]TWJ28647.1 acyl carrier protein [Micromonospora sagamiensis]BCL12448.1 acyl carrier protein [Micromonospora sagamiensis]
MSVDQATILAEVAAMVHAIRDDAGVDGEITMATRFQDDLEMESIDVISLAGRLQARYGNVVNFAQFVAKLDLDSIRQLRVGHLVAHIATALDGADADAGHADAGLGTAGRSA